MRSSSLVLALVMLLLAATPTPALQGCRYRTGQHVVLYGTTDDPDVFLWDSRFRLRDYEGGSFDQMKALLPHAALARPGTRAVVESCVQKFVASKYLDRPDDAVGIVIVSGNLRGQRGWVLGSAVRANTRGPRDVSTRSTSIPDARAIISGVTTAPGRSKARSRSAPSTMSRSA